MRFPRNLNQIDVDKSEQVKVSGTGSIILIRLIFMAGAWNNDLYYIG
jgi:hypothetical protein